MSWRSGGSIDDQPVAFFARSHAPPSERVGRPIEAGVTMLVVSLTGNPEVSHFSAKISNEDPNE